MVVEVNVDAVLLKRFNRLIVLPLGWYKSALLLPFPALSLEEVGTGDVEDAVEVGEVGDLCPLMTSIKAFSTSCVGL